MNYHIDVADDKSTGWTSYLFPGTRGNIQKDVNKRRNIINLTKFRLALRFAWAKRLYTLAPHELVQLGLRDPCVAFIKREGHPARKKETKTWRLIWVVSELDRLIDASVFTELEKADIATYQSAPRAEKGMARNPSENVFDLSVGVGHDDDNLERTYFELAGFP